jgi:RNA polymerase sigma factor (sigma-70 family)
VAAASVCRQRPEAPSDGIECSRVRTAAAHIAMRFRLSRSDAEDLHGDLWVRLLANEGHVLRSYRGTARIETYLTTIARNLVLDGRRRVHGKWRASARARRFGSPGIELERLIAHQGFSIGAAIGRVAARWPDADRAALTVFADSIERRPRRVEVGTDALFDQPCRTRSPFQILADREEARDGESLGRALSRALLSLDEADRQLVIARYIDGRTVAELASAFGLDQKALYRRFDRLIQRLRSSLENGGFRAREAAALVGADATIRCAVLRRGEQRRARRSDLLHLVRSNGE